MIIIIIIIIIIIMIIISIASLSHGELVQRVVKAKSVELAPGL